MYHKTKQFIILIMAMSIGATIFHFITLTIKEAKAVELIEKCPVCECPRTLVERIKGEINKHNLLKDAGYIEEDIKDIISNKESITNLIK